MLRYLPGSRGETIPHQLHHHLELSVDLLEELRQVATTDIRSNMRIYSQCYCHINVIANYACQLVYIARVCLALCLGPF